MAITLTVVGAAQQVVPAAQQFEEAVTLIETRRDYAAAARIFERVAEAGDRSLAARALLYLGACYERIAQERAKEAYARVLNKYADQPAAVAQARARLAALTRAGAAPPLGRSFRPLWEGARPAALFPGRISRNGRFLPLVTADGLVLQDLATERLGAPVRLFGAAAALPGCEPDPPVVLSPDGYHIAYACVPEGGGLYELRVARVDGSLASRRLVSAPLHETIELLDWAADTLLVQFRLPNGHARLVIVPVSGSPATHIVNAATPIRSAGISAHSRWVVYEAPAADPRSGQDIFIVPAAGGAARALIAGPFGDRFPMWTPGGEGILFVSDRTGSAGLWFQRIREGRASGEPRLVFPDLGRIVTSLGVSDTGRLLYWRETGLVDVYVVNLDPAGLPAGAPRNSSTSRIGQNLMPAWSPDGSELAYVARERGIVIRNVSSGVERTVGTELTNVVHPRWSPDGSMLLVRGYDANKRYGIFTVATSIVRVTAVKTVAAAEESALSLGRWANQGREVICFFAGRILRIDVNTGDERIIHTFPPGLAVATPDVSTVDESIIFVQTDRATGKSTIAVRSVDGSTRELLASGPGEILRNPVWVPGNHAVLFVRHGPDPARPGARLSSLRRLDLRDNSVRALDLSLDDVRDPAISPDGRHLAFTAGRPTREPWVLENFLPSVVGSPTRQ